MTSGHEYSPRVFPKVMPVVLAKFSLGEKIVAEGGFPNAEELAMESGRRVDRDSAVMAQGMPLAFAKLSRDICPGTRSTRSRARAPPFSELHVHPDCLKKAKGEAMGQHRLSGAPDRQG